MKTFRVAGHVRQLIAISSAMLVNVVCAAGVAEELTDSEFQRLHRRLRPGADERWRTIPWKIALLDAQRVATKEKKPLFIWAMDGHPLGCT